MSVLSRRASIFGLAALAAGVFTAHGASAQSPRSEAFPADGAVLHEAPERVVVRFSSGIQSRSTRISLIGPTDSSQLSVEGSGGPPVRELSIPVQDQGHGRYVVRWEIVSSRGERLGGRVRFLVRE